jgi:hypothetical protein
VYHHLGNGVTCAVDRNGAPIRGGGLGQEDFSLPAPGAPAGPYPVVPLKVGEFLSGLSPLFGLTWGQLLLGAAVVVGGLWFFWPRPRRHRVARVRR